MATANRSITIMSAIRGFEIRLGVVVSLMRGHYDARALSLDTLSAQRFLRRNKEVP
jgi:hypothetical protein